VANIVKLNYKNYVKLGVSKQDYFEILYFVNGPRFGRFHLRTILLGNEEQYEMVYRNIKLYEVAFDISNHGNIVFLFPLLKLSSLWKTCGVRHYPFPEFVCLESLTLTEHKILEGEITGRIWRFISWDRSPRSTRLGNHKFYFHSSVDEILLDEIFYASNESQLQGSYVDENESNIVVVQSSLTLPVMKGCFVVLDELEANFLSWYFTPVLRFEMYVRPFQLQLWIMIGLFLTIIMVFIHVYNRNRILSPSFSPFFFFVSTLFDEPYSVPTAMWNDTKFKTITIAWLLTAMMFTNLYNGQLTTDLSTPLREQALFSFDDVFGAYNSSSTGLEPRDDMLRFWSSNYTESEPLPKAKSNVKKM
jgi:hypothetical protein